MLHAKYGGESLLPWYSRANLPEKFYFVIPDARTKAELLQIGIFFLIYLFA